jgi:hypothetical protein
MSGATRTVRALDPEGRHAANLAIAANNGTGALKLLLELDKGQRVGWEGGGAAAFPDMTGKCAPHAVDPHAPAHPPRPQSWRPSRT